MRNALSRCGAYLNKHAGFLIAMVAIFVTTTGSAWATTVASCDTMATSPSVDSAIDCMIDTVAPYSLLVKILGGFLPVILVIWGLRGGFSLIARIVGSMFSFLIRRG